MNINLTEKEQSLLLFIIQDWYTANPNDKEIRDSIIKKLR